MRRDCLRFSPVWDWPPLAWLAVAHRGSDQVTIYHGPRVETGPGWFCEAVWDGEFEAAGFDRTDLVFGSGGRLRDDGVHFVSPGSTVDRLHALEAEGTTWVSNSLSCLLRAAGAELDPGYDGYYKDFHSVVRGLSACVDRLRCSKGEVRLIYFDNVCLGPTGLRIAPKPRPERDFGDFAGYSAFLRQTMGRLAANAGSAGRRHPFRLLGTLSRGYDSTTAAILARDAGCRRVLCFDRARKGEDDSGVANARRLGLEPEAVPTNAWRTLHQPEIAFIAANAMGEEVRVKAAEDELDGTLLITGYHGDKMWDKHTKNLSADIVRGDPSGSALSEYRLQAGFLHCPVPFWGVHQIADVHRISNSDEMRPWDWGGDYSRPICRRIGEEAGLAREDFGVSKLAASVMLHEYEDFLTPGSLDDYLGWLAGSAAQWRRWRRRPPYVSRTLLGLDRASFGLMNQAATALKRLPLAWRLGHTLDRSNHHHYLRSYIFPWSIERNMQRYSPLDAVAGRAASVPA